MRKALLFLLILCIGCRKGAPLPGKAQLVLPANNEVCAESNVISATQSIVMFSWRAAANANNYTLNIKNLETGNIFTQTTDKIQMEVTLDRDSPYSWYVSASRDGQETSSDTWKFYNPGPAATSYAPFPADLLSPGYEEVIPASKEKIILRWNCADPDNDISVYNVYLGTNSKPPLFRSDVIRTSLEDITLSRQKRYYWRIQAVDARGNKSDSEIYSFLVN